MAFANIEIFDQIIINNASEKELLWLNEKLAKVSAIPISFVAVPRFIEKKALLFEKKSQVPLFHNWTLDRLVRVFLLLKFEQNTSKILFDESLKTLFETAEINEAIALYSALPYLQRPESWLLQATDAVRSNIGGVFDSLVFNNEYPSKYFSELAWNQMVLKCIFNGKSIQNIIGLSNRLNQNLADTFSDFAHERWAAGRTVPVNAWQLISPFLNSNLINDIEKLFLSKESNNRNAAWLVCCEAKNILAKNLLEKYSLTEIEMENAKKDWASFQ